MKMVIYSILILFLLNKCTEKHNDSVIKLTDSLSMQKKITINPSINTNNKNVNNGKTFETKSNNIKIDNNNVKFQEKQNPNKNPYKNSKLTYILIDSENGTYGYEIYIDGKKYIHQVNIPGLPGNKGFADKNSAAKIAEFVISKIQKNIMPPTVTLNELDSLDIIK